jgi:hypothetical protein
LWQWPQPLPQQLSQAGASQQAGSQQAGASQQAGSQQAGASQQAGSQQLVAQQRFLWQSNSPFRPQNRSQRFLQQPFPQLSQAGASQQAGSQQAGASQQLGSQQAGASQQAGSQQAGASQQAGSQHDVAQQLLQRPPPSIRSSSSKPKPWLHRLALITSAPRTIFHFIEQRLLTWNCGAHPQHTRLGLEPLLLAKAQVVLPAWLVLVRGEPRVGVVLFVGGEVGSSTRSSALVWRQVRRVIPSTRKRQAVA